MVFKASVNWESQLPFIHEKGLEGWSMASLAEHYGVSRQRMKQIIDKYFPNWQAECGFIVHRRKKVEEHFQKWGDKQDTDLYRSQRFKFKTKKYNAERIGHKWDVEFGDLVWPTHCPILGLELDYFNAFRSENSPSFDQLIPGKGYTKDNVRVISYRANRIKNDGTSEEHRRIADYLDTLV
jgi:hypothetical protein